jgi:pyridoxamine 5'-phosphate oxidase
MDPQVAGRLRRDYESEGLHESHMASDPITEFETWFAGVLEAGIEEPNAFVVATVGPDGRPSARAVLMKEFSDQGITFYTGLSSRKSLDLMATPHAAATFVWVPLHRQVRFEGLVEGIDEETADAYFSTRPRGAQIAAHASVQSRVVASREELGSRFDELSAEFGDGPVPRPSWWGGWRLRPDTVEFWQGRPNRFHDRIVYRHEGGSWSMERLAP